MSVRSSSFAAFSLFFVLSSCQNDEAKAEKTDAEVPEIVPVEGGISSRPLPERKNEGPGDTLFELLEPGHTGVDFGLRWDDPAAVIKEFLFLNPSGGICAGDIDGDHLADLYITSPDGGNRLYRNLGGFRFEDVTESSGVQDKDFWGTGASFVDLDNDGDLDLFACGYLSPNKAYLNDGTGKFTDRAKDLGLDFKGGSMMMSFADIDNDGDLDGYLATTAVAPPEGTKFKVNFIPRESDGVEVPVVIPELREYWDILYMPGDKVRRVEAAQYDRLFRNDGGRFVEVAKESGIDGNYFTLSATWVDYDQDGDADLYVSNDYTGPDMLYRNRGDGTFENVIRTAMPHTPWFSMGSDVGDLNNDGLPDLFASDMSATSHYREKVMMGNMEDSAWFLEWAEPRQYMRNAVYVNSGTERFHEVAFMAGLSSTDWTWTPRIEDFDQDGHVDVFVTNGVMRDNMNSDLTEFANKNLKAGTKDYNDFWLGKPMRKEKNLAFRNLTDLKFEPIGKEWGLEREGVSFGAVTADFDGDGDPDLAVSNADAPVSLYRNNGEGGSRIAVKLAGVAANKQGLGATIRVEAGGKTQTRIVTLARGWLSAGDPTALFGLGEVEKVDRLEVLWPGGTRQVFEDLEVNHVHTISEPVGQSAPPREDEVEPLFVRSGALAEARHREVPYDDFKKQPLLPNKLSQHGPGMAWGDVDGDGDDDFYLSGARDQSGQLFLNSGEGTFSPKASKAFEAASASEGLGAFFFDSDGDGDLDLFVANGSNEASPGDPVYLDHLFLNDGKGEFTLAPSGTLPEVARNSGVVTAADVDHDGDLDLFVGSRVVPGQYPLASASQLLINEGGRFRPVDIPDLGMVTGAVFSDADHDGWVDLLVTIEWGPVRFLKNEEGRLIEKTAEAGLDQRSGWWNGIAAGDVDGDGDLDYLVTNYGLNTKYKASEKKPALLYYGDVDGSGESHLIEAKYADGKLLPRRGYSCSKGAMPSLQTKVGSFHNFASAALDELYSDSRLEQALKLEVNTLESGVLINDGNARFSWQPLPRFAQISPSFGVVLEDLDLDGDLDAVLAQNSFSAQRETGRMGGGLSMMLANDGKGIFSPVMARRSGIVVPADAQSLTIGDLNNDGRADLVIGKNDGPVETFLNQGKEQGLCVLLTPDLIGTRLEMNGLVREYSGGGGYLSQSGGLVWFPTPSEDSTLLVKKLNLATEEISIPKGSTSILVK